MENPLQRDLVCSSYFLRFALYCSNLQTSQHAGPRGPIYAPSGAIYPGGPSIWHVIDWDQRRLISVMMDHEMESPDLAFDRLLKHIDHLPSDVYLIHLSPEGDVISMSNNTEDDETLCVYRPPLGTAQLPDSIHSISRAQLQEVARLAPNVDLVAYPNSTRPGDRV